MTADLTLTVNEIGYYDLNFEFSLSLILMKENNGIGGSVLISTLNLTLQEVKMLVFHIH